MEQLIVSRENTFSYPIYFDNSYEELGNRAKEVLNAGRRICLVTDSNVGPLYSDEVAERLRAADFQVSVYEVPAGEAYKNLDTVSGIYSFLCREGFERRDYLAALGGGVIGDMTGFAAATYLRGIDFIQIPTTLLAQVDSSVGGKTGVDLNQYKNMVGAFHQPRMVYMNFSVLKTLPPVQFASGMGEVLKTALLADGAFYGRLLHEAPSIRALEYEPVSRAVRRCCEIKADIVQRDPKEKGERALLNLGHTLGHAIEKLMNFTLPHGQCVGLGLIAAARISAARGNLSPEEEASVREGLILYGLPTAIPEGSLTCDDILAAARKDKKMDQGKIRFILLKSIGHAMIDTSVTEEEMREALLPIL